MDIKLYRKLYRRVNIIEKDMCVTVTRWFKVLFSLWLFFTQFHHQFMQISLMDPVASHGRPVSLSRWWLVFIAPAASRAGIQAVYE